MDTIKLEIPFDKNEFLKSCSIRKKIMMTRVNWNLTISVLGLVFFCWQTKFHKTVGSSFNFNIVGVLIFGFVATLMFLIKTIGSYLFKSKINGKAKRLEALRTNFTYEISDKSVKYSDNERTEEHNWKYFANYSIYMDHLVIMKHARLVSHTFANSTLTS